MKKLSTTLFILALLALGLTGCENKWDHSDPKMPDEVRAQHQSHLDDELAVLEANPNDTNAMFLIAFEYQALGDFKSAVDYYNQVLEHLPQDAVTLNNLADMYEQMEDYDTAAEYIKQLYKVKPDDIEVIRDTVRILLEDKNPGNALEALDHFATLQTESDPTMTEFISELRQQIADYTTAHPQQ